MIKRLFIVAILTGTGHFVNLISLKFITNHANEATIAFIGELDSLTLLMVSIIAFGLQLSSTRELAILDKDWQEVYYTTQSARFTLSLFLMLLGGTGFIYTKNYLFFIAPVIALNADYALYGRGKPVLGAMVAFIRVFVPSITIIISSVYFINELPLLFCLSIVISYFLVGFVVSKILLVNYFVKPSLKSLLKYVKNVKIGLANVAYFFIGVGILNILSYFNSNQAISIAYMALKLYMIFIGVRRIIVQSFFKEIKEMRESLKVDYLSMIAGVMFLSFFLFYPKLVITMLFDDSYTAYQTTFIILGCAGFVSSITSSSGARLLLKNKDKQFSYNFIIAAVVTIVSGICFSLFMVDTPSLIALAILLGEITVSILNILSLNEKGYLINRLKLIYPVVLIAFLFFVIKYCFNENIWTFSYSILLFSLLVSLYSKKVLKTKSLSYNDLTNDKNKK